VRESIIESSLSLVDATRRRLKTMPHPTGLLRKPTGQVRAVTACIGPAKDSMEGELRAVLAEAYDFRVAADGFLERERKFSDPEISMLHEDIWNIQMQYGPDTNLLEFAIYHGREVMYLQRHW
jgi:hypothetical protein